MTPHAIELPAGLTPWDAFRRLSHLPWPLLLESSAPDPALGRYSYVVAQPRRLFRAEDGIDPWQPMAQALTVGQRETLAGLPPFQGGLAGLFSYDLGRTLERLQAPRRDEFRTPALAVGLYGWVLAFDHRLKQAWWIGDRREEHDELLPLLYEEAEPQALPSEDVLPAGELAQQFALPLGREVTSNFSREDYLRAVRRAIDYIHAGDCFQVNLSQRLLAPAQDPIALYAKLRRRSPSPFGGLFLGESFAVVSSSPERFLQMDAGGRIETRPIKGTRPRRSPVEADAAAALELLDSAKDRAENVMIVDLLRNDLGRVCEYGSVRVEAVCDVESYASVHHLVSVVAGQLRPGLGAIDLLKAAFPGGSVTGAPKVRAMEIIGELEPTARGPYCGCLAWLGFDGAMDSNILIRTFTWAKGWLQFPVGGGIVAESDPDEEHEETLTKAAGMLRALEE